MTVSPMAIGLRGLGRRESQDHLMFTAFPCTFTVFPCVCFAAFS